MSFRGSQVRSGQVVLRAYVGFWVAGFGKLRSKRAGASGDLVNNGPAN